MPDPEAITTKRPLPVAIIGWLFIATGVVSIAYHAADANNGEYFWVLFLRLLAIVGGAFVLRGANWARWLLAAWLAYHLYLSFFHSIAEVAVHGAILSLLAYFLFRGNAAAYFHGAAGHSGDSSPA